MSIVKLEKRQKKLEKKTKQIRRVYDFYAGFYDFVFGKIFDEGRLKALEWMTQSALEKPLRVLEVGCGTGRSLRFYPNSFEVTAFDFSAKMVQVARKHLDRWPSNNVQLMQMDAMNMELESDSYDAVIMAYVISAVPDPKRVMEEARRVCKPGGRIFLINHFKKEHKLVGGLEKALAPVFSRLGWTTDLQLQTLLDHTGLDVKRACPVNAFGYWQLVECVNSPVA